jgi:hypothetical protein
MAAIMQTTRGPNGEDMVLLSPDEYQDLIDARGREAAMQAVAWAAMETLSEQDVAAYLAANYVARILAPLSGDDTAGTCRDGRRVTGINRPDREWRVGSQSGDAAGHRRCPADQDERSGAVAARVPQGDRHLPMESFGIWRASAKPTATATGPATAALGRPRTAPKTPRCRHPRKPATHRAPTSPACATCRARCCVHHTSRGRRRAAVGCQAPPKPARVML